MIRHHISVQIIVFVYEKLNMVDNTVILVVRLIPNHNRRCCDIIMLISNRAQC